MAKLEPPFPSSPSRPPKHHVSFFRGDRLFSGVGFGATYSAKKFIEAVVGESETRWRDNDAFHVPDIGVTIKCSELEHIIEYKLKGAETEWELPENYMVDASAIASGERRKLTSKRAPTGDEEERMKKSMPDETKNIKAKRSAPAPRATPDGYVGLADICKDIGMEPRDARAILRKTIEKPDMGWAWPKKEVDDIKRRLKGSDAKGNKEKDDGGKPSKAKADKSAPAGKRKSRR